MEEQNVELDNSSQIEMVEFSRLPPEILEVILLQVDDLHDLFQIGKVSMQLRMFMKRNDIFPRWLVKKMGGFSLTDIWRVEHFIRDFLGYSIKYLDMGMEINFGNGLGFYFYADGYFDSFVITMDMRWVTPNRQDRKWEFYGLKMKLERAGLTLKNDEIIEEIVDDNGLIRQININLVSALQIRHVKGTLSSFNGDIFRILGFLCRLDMVFQYDYHVPVAFDAQSPFCLLALLHHVKRWIKEADAPTSWEYNTLLKQLKTGVVTFTDVSESGQKRLIRNKIKSLCFF